MIEVQCNVHAATLFENRPAASFERKQRQEALLYQSIKPPLCLNKANIVLAHNELRLYTRLDKDKTDLKPAES